MQNASPAFGFLTQNLSLTCYYILVFHIPSEMGKKGIRIRYVDFLILQSKLKCTADMN